MNDIGLTAIMSDHESLPGIGPHIVQVLLKIWCNDNSLPIGAIIVEDSTISANTENVIPSVAAKANDIRIFKQLGPAPPVQYE